MGLAKCQHCHDEVEPQAVHGIDEVLFLSLPSQYDHDGLERERDSPQKPAKSDFTLRSHPDALEGRDEADSDAKLEHHIGDCRGLELPPQQACCDTNHENDTIVHSHPFELPLKESKYEGENALDTANGRKKASPAVFRHRFVGCEVEERHKAPRRPRSNVWISLSLESLPIIDAEGEDIEKSRQNTEEYVEFQRASFVQADGIVSLMSQ